MAEKQYAFYEVASLDEIPSGERLLLEIDGFKIVVFNLGGELFAVDDTCSHEDCSLGEGDLEGYEIICPCHFARFDIRTGKVLAPPAVVDIATYPVRVEEGKVFVGIPEEGD